MGASEKNCTAIIQFKVVYVIYSWRQACFVATTFNSAEFGMNLLNIFASLNDFFDFPTGKFNVFQFASKSLSTCKEKVAKFVCCSSQKLEKR